MWRTFFAIDLPERVREPIARWQAQLRATGCAASYPDPAQLHLTLVFLGNIFAAQAPLLAARLDAVAACFVPFCVELRAWGCFGAPSAPRVVWVGVQAPPALALLQARLAEAAGDLGLPIETRPFRPHVTLARIKSARNVAALTSLVASHKNASLGEIQVTRVVLLRSHLDQPRATYSTLHAAPMKGS